MSRSRESSGLKQKAAQALRQSGFRNRDIARLLDVSDGYVSILLRGSRKTEFPFVLVDDEKAPVSAKIDRTQDPRALRMVELYKAGKTLEEIGHEFGVTRERARQLIRPLISRSEGGISLRKQQLALQAKTERATRRDERARRIFGCDYETALRLNRNIPPKTNAKGTLAAAYVSQKEFMCGSYGGNVEYSLTFPQWVEAWGENIHQRGRGKWGLFRIDSKLGFVAGNVRAMPIKENASKTIAHTMSRMKQIQSMEEAGVPRDQIAQQLGVTRGYLNSLRCYSRRMIQN